MKRGKGQKLFFRRAILSWKSPRCLPCLSNTLGWISCSPGCYSQFTPSPWGPFPLLHQYSAQLQLMLAHFWPAVGPHEPSTGISAAGIMSLKGNSRFLLCLTSTEQLPLRCLVHHVSLREAIRGTAWMLSELMIHLTIKMALYNLTPKDLGRFYHVNPSWHLLWV